MTPSIPLALTPYQLGQLTGTLLIVILVFAVLWKIFRGPLRIVGILVGIILTAGLLINSARRSGKLTIPNQTAENATVQSSPPADLPAHDAELVRLSAEAKRHFIALEKERIALDPNNAKAVAAYNQRLAAYQGFLTAIEKRKATRKD